ncbi:peptidoglycan-binding protein [Chondromyces apiculatus]|uniref:Membrane protein n=1 Tax=Chondromyces apiculatus DSM 436 TaxID=1192034 RepID=A0A017TH16_9BACT|nr:peptidoglycan-binding protein [Chondromyces apiculatus]EYF08105.1 Membrane protein [Chondromyces apiculatus DSM 436]
MTHPTLRLTDGYPDVSPFLNADVKALQRELVRWGYTVKPDGRFGPSTQAAVKSFQRKQGLRDDGIVGNKTWGLLTAKQATQSVGTGFSTSVPPAQTPVVSTGGDGRFFPLSRIYSESWTKGAGMFGSGRGGGRAHAGCDLYAPLGTWVHAIMGGTVTLGPYYFYCNTYAIEVDHGEFVARYGEVQKDSPVRKGDKVKAGQRIARVGHLVGISVKSDMLHLELYKGTHSGSLTVKGSGSAVSPRGQPYQRRKDLMDPTPLLAQWRKNLPVD